MTRDDWLRWRHEGIGSSDASVLHNLSPWKTNLQLYHEKINPPVLNSETSFIQQKGLDLEPIARARFAAFWNLGNETNEDFAPACIEMRDYPYIKASLDGASHDRKTIIEIKYQGAVPHEETKLGLIPEKYVCQMQHQLLVSGATSCYFVSYDGETLNCCEIFPDIEFLGKHLVKCVEFWDMVTNKIPPIEVKKAKRKAKDIQ